MEKNVIVKRRQYQSRYRTRIQEEPKVNFFKIKIIISCMILTLIISLHQFNLTIGTLSSEQVFSTLYNNEDISKFTKTYFNLNRDTIKTFWNNQK